ncbi:acyl-CoA dehydrogenase family protein [Nocardia asteroides]|uniref:acyl-CoA dehydrogenase family protein n=1 Tax=Nocardia asteroides TaxID=1824 RepID=UPI001E5B963E|nr:acyl-CoA dehydrogenase family protein [Nocardia asteroides]UGT53068.1 acyl-CoA/acyl-ACP dehydrogenase [Nocardia asteroides]
MRFALSTEQLDFAAELRKILEAGQIPAAVRAWSAGDTDKGRALLRQLAEMGVFGLIVDEKYDGADATPVDLVVALIETGRAALPGPVIESAAVIPALLQRLPDAGTAQQWLPGLASGESLGTITFDDPQRGIALDAAAADLVLTATADRLALGAGEEALSSIDPARKLVQVAADATLAEGAETADALRHAFDVGVLACAAQLLGAGRAILEQTTTYAKQRKQFGRVIGEFQAVKQQLADVLIALDLAEPLVYRAALTLDSADRARDVSAALVACGDAAHRAARVGLQVHGAIGYTAECDLSLWLTRVAALRTAWGTADFHRGRIAAALREPAAV